EREREREREREHKLTKGISLIVLVITIIIIIILAGAIILSLSNNNIIEKTKESVFKSDIKTMQSELNMYTYNKKIEMLNNYDSTKLNANYKEVVDNGIVITGFTIADIITSLKDKSYINEYCIKERRI
ncbi:MAG: hypothetical protein RSC92_01250, partial [Clostridia bacterium]